MVQKQYEEYNEPYNRTYRKMKIDSLVELNFPSNSGGLDTGSVHVLVLKDSAED